MTTAETHLAERMGFAPGQSVVEIGYEEDTDLELRESIEAVTGKALLDEEADVDGAVDAVLLWSREGDGALADAKNTLADGGVLWLLTPRRAGRDAGNPVTSRRT
ncbi:DUF3052 family protein [Streptomyces sp. NPDC057217]|uniref:DUF3052 family protein n=1 Tax=Streptomyces sp. NPDC057217 TaxID=3346054 RepID=UPI00362B93DA